MAKEFIRIGGAREHNLKNLTLNIPRDKLVVITGLSGSGKSSLAFDTIFAEGQRKYVESLSAYARQFLDQMQKPEVDFIEGLSPAIAIEQRSSGANPRSTIAVVVDRLVIDDKIRIRLSDSVETALKWGQGRLLSLHQMPEARSPGREEGGVSRSALPAGPPPHVGGYGDQWTETLYSNRLYSPATGRTFDPLTPKHFSFNSPLGACPVCHGLGQKMVFDEGLIVPDPEISLEQGAILPWRRGGKRMVVYYKSTLRAVTQHYGQSLEAPYKSLADHFKRVLLRGSGPELIEFHFWRAGKMSSSTRPFEGVVPNLERLYQESESEFTKSRLKAFLS